MDTENIIMKCAALTLEVCVSCLMYKLYRTESERLRSLKEAQCLELDAELKKNVEKNGEIKYAAVTGKIRALTSSLHSQYVPHLSGVIREKITVERKVKWNPFLGVWGSANNDLSQTMNCIPFALCGKAANNIFKKRISVEVTEPLTARGLVIPTVHDEFQCHHDTLGDAVFSIIRAEKTLGIQEIERMLCENETLTAVGKLVIENNKLQIKPPDGGLTYFLTPLSLESLIKEVHISTKLYQVTSIVMGTLSFALFVYFSWPVFREIKRKIVRHRERKKWEEERRLRRMADKARNTQDANVPKCIVCLDNPIETIILECGHICLCYDCSEHIQNLCPICRNPITRTISAFWP